MATYDYDAEQNIKSLIELRRKLIDYISTVLADPENHDQLFSLLDNLNTVQLAIKNHREIIAEEKLFDKLGEPKYGDKFDDLEDLISRTRGK